MKYRSPWAERLRTLWPTGWPFLAFLCTSVIALSVTSIVMFDRDDKQYLTAKSEKLAHGLALHLQRELDHSTTILRIFGQTVILRHANEFEKTAESVAREFPHLFAINFVAPSGEITRVYPVEPNRAALGQNLLQRSELREYLVLSRTDRRARMSHRIMTYQKVSAFVLYIPLYDDKDEFFGWVNGVVDVDQWLERYAHQNGVKDTRISISWDHPDSETAEFGPNLSDSPFEFRQQVLNQRLTIRIGFAPTETDMARSQSYFVVLMTGFCLLLFSVLLTLRLHHSRQKLAQSLRELDTKNSLLTSLTHDLSTPLTALDLGMELVNSASATESPELRESLHRTMDVITDMVVSAKRLHENGFGWDAVATGPTPLFFGVREGIDMISAQARLKKLKVSVSDLPVELQVVAEAKSLGRNVVANALIQAVQSSPTGGEIKIYAKSSEETVHLYIEDQGFGLNPDQLTELRRFIQNAAVPNRSVIPTIGLGFIQIQSFMRAYGGRAEIENVSGLGGGRVILTFKRGYGWDPLAR